MHLIMMNPISFTLYFYVHWIASKCTDFIIFFGRIILIPAKFTKSDIYVQFHNSGQILLGGIILIPARFTKSDIYVRFHNSGQMSGFIILAKYCWAELS